MSRYAAIFLVVALAACPSPFSREAASTPSSSRAGPQGPVEEVRAALKNTRAYRAKLVATMNPAMLLNAPLPDKLAPQELKKTMTSELAVALPDRMNHKFSTKSPDAEVRANLVYTGKKVWVSTSMIIAGEGGKARTRQQTIKLDQARLATPGRPFDVGYNIQGHGLDSGEDLVGTMLSYLKRYRFTVSTQEEVVRGEPCLLLTGQQDQQAAIAEFFSRPRTLGGLVMAQKARDEAEYPLVPGGGMVGSAARVLKATAVLRLWVSRKDHLPRRWTLGDQDEDLVDVRVTELATSVKHPEGTFKVEPEQLKRAVDYTEGAREQLKKVEDACKDSATVARVRAELERLLKE